jgi:hypothetical protein
MRTYFLLPHLLSNALVGVHGRARAFPLDNSIPIGTTSLDIEHEHAAQGRLGELSQTKESKHSPSRDVQHQNIDHFGARKGNLVAKHSEPTTLPKSSTERSVDLYALRVPLYDQEGYMAIFLSNETAVTFCKDVSEALYDDSEKVFLHLDLRLGNSTTEIPVREDNAIGFCQKVKRKEQVGDGSSSPTRTSSRITGGTVADESAGGSTTARPSEANKSTVASTAKPTSIEESPEPPKAFTREATDSTPISINLPTRTPKPKPRPSLTATKAASPTHSMPDLETINFEFPGVFTPSSHKTPTPTSSPSILVPPSTNQTDSGTDTKVKPDADSAAWGKIHDPRMVWTVGLLWVLVGLQVVCGFWEFRKNNRGKGRGDLVGRVRWWDEKARAVE